jgi:hypothetical protein
MKEQAMSCHIITHADVQIAVRGLKVYQALHNPRALNLADDIAMGGQALATAILQLNMLAFTSRYQGRYLDEIDQSHLDFVFQKTSPPASLLMTIKTVQYIIYQCSEDGAAKEPLYDYLRHCEYEMLQNYVQALPDWSKLPWGSKA